jgi:hypothetical protein
MKLRSQEHRTHPGHNFNQGSHRKNSIEQHIDCRLALNVNRRPHRQILDRTAH